MLIWSERHDKDRSGEPSLQYGRSSGVADRTPAGHNPHGQNLPGQMSGRGSILHPTCREEMATHDMTTVLDIRWRHFTVRYHSERASNAQLREQGWNRLVAVRSLDN